jgi:hypothetical protein
MKSGGAGVDRRHRPINQRRNTPSLRGKGQNGNTAEQSPSSSSFPSLCKGWRGRLPGASGRAKARPAIVAPGSARRAVPGQNDRRTRCGREGGRYRIRFVAAAFAAAHLERTPFPGLRTRSPGLRLGSAPSRAPGIQSMTQARPRALRSGLVSSLPAPPRNVPLWYKRAS